MPGPVRLTSVAVLAPDDLTRAGLVEILDAVPGVRTAPSPATADVVVLGADAVSAAVLRTVRTSAGTAGRPVVLVLAEPAITGDDVVRAVAAGVRAVVARSDADGCRLGRAIAAVASGGADLPPAQQGALVAEIVRVERDVLAPQGLSAVGLTEREAAILAMLADGRDVAEIAAELAYSERTVTNVLSGVLRRLGVTNRTQAVAHAVRTGLI